MKKKRVSIKNLKPGMTLANPIYRYNDMQIVPGDTVITDALITRLNFYSVSEVYVWDIPLVFDHTPIPSSSYFERVQNSGEFKSFKANYMNVSNNVKSTMNSLLVQNDVQKGLSSITQSTMNLLHNGNTNLHVFDMLHNMRNMDDPTYIHSINTALIAAVIGTWCDIPAEDLNVLTLCGLLHDIGKLKIPKHILQKPAKLTEEEYKVMKTHSSQGYHLLSAINGLDERIGLAALEHHERCDGSGYPFALYSNRIHDFAKIVSIADVYDAMSSARVYRGPICPFDVIALFESEGYAMFDPRFLLPFMQNVTNSYLNTSVQLSNGETGVVIMINKNTLSAPVIQCRNTYLDLSKEKHIKIQCLI